MGKNRKKQKFESKTESKINKNFNFKGGELFLRMSYLGLLSKNMISNKAYDLSSIYITKLKRIKERNNLKIGSDFNKKTCSKCSFNLDICSNYSINKESGNQILLRECKFCKYINRTFIKLH